MAGSSRVALPVTYANLIAEADKTTGKRIGLYSFTDSLDNTAVKADGPTMPSGKTLQAQLAGKDPVFHQLAGVFGVSDNQGVMGLTSSNSGTGVYGGNMDAPNGFGVRGDTVGGVAVQGQSFGSGLAGKFIGNVETTGNHTVGGDASVTGNHTVHGNVVVSGDVLLPAGAGDCAEQFDAAGAEVCEPGTVMVIDGTGALLPSGQEYDRRVAGVVSGAGKFRPALVLDNQPDSARRVTIALVGKVYCKAVASERPIEVGDLLTTSPLEGHAMKATDQMRAFGAIIGKALQPLPSGTGLIPVLIALQ